MDLVSNVVLANSPTPQADAPAGKSSSGSFAALLQPQPAVTGEASEANDKDKSPNAHSGNKSSKSQSNQKPEAEQQGTSTQPVLLAQTTVLPLAVSLSGLQIGLKEKGTSAGEPASASNGSGLVSVGAQGGSSATAGVSTEQLLAQMLYNPPNIAAAVGASDLSAGKKAIQQAENGSSAKLDVKQSKTDLKDIQFPAAVNDPSAAEKLLNLTGGESAVQSKATDSAKQNIQAQAAVKSAGGTKAAATEISKATEGPKPEAGEQGPTVKLPVAQNSSKTTQAIESLAASAVSIALKQTIPAQSKVVAASSGSTLSNKGLASASNAMVHSQNNGVSAHAAAPVQETQATHDQSKKQQSETPQVVAGSNADQTQEQVSAAGRALSSTTNGTDQPRQVSNSAPNSTSSPLRQDAPAEAPATALGTPVSLHSARLLESLGQSELRVGIKMGDLGNVEIRTQLHHDQVRAEISVERGDLSRSLAAELPALQQKLHEHDMPLASIVINHQAAAGSGGFERGSQQQQAHTPIAHIFGIDSPTVSFSPDEVRSTESGLDIRI